MRTAFWVIFGAGVILAFASGCTERERLGYSSIPQNSPASWEIRPYGELRN